MTRAKPNLLFIYTDEQAFNTLACYGNGRIDMPHLNRLADRSTVFEEAYVTQPVCTPSRSTLLTGLYPHSNGCTENNVPLRANTPCLPELLDDPDYICAHYGKWHLGDEVFPQHGFTEWRSVEDGYAPWYGKARDPDTPSSYHTFLLEQGFRPENGRRFNRNEAAQLPEEAGKPAFLAAEASRFIREHRDRPFVLHVNFLEPHMPFFGPRDGQYDPAEVPLPDNFDAWPAADQPLKARLFAEAYRATGTSGLPLKTGDDWRRLRANYWGLCSLVDTHVGRILDALRESGAEDDTLIVFTSDHGDMMGSHHLIAKCVMFQEAVRVPLLVHLPGQREQRRVAGPVSQIDLVPTLLDLMGKPAPGHLQGESLRPLLETAGARADRDVVIEWQGPNTGIIGESVDGLQPPAGWEGKATRAQVVEAVTDPVRTLVTPDGWTCGLSPRGEHQLYDLANDPGETRNLAGDPKQRDRLQDARRRIDAWRERTADR